MSGRPDRRIVVGGVVLLVVLIALTAVGVRWYLASYTDTPGGLRESEARNLCGEQARWETGYGEDAELDLWGATAQPDGQGWAVDGQIFRRHIDGVDVTHGTRSDGEQFRCEVSEDSARVTMVD